MAFVCKQTAVWWSTSITLDNNNAVLKDYFSFNTYHIPQIALLDVFLLFFQF